MRVLQRDADLAVHLEAADAGAVACARVDDDERTLVRIGRGVTCRHPELHERVIRGPLELASIEDHVVFEDEHRRLPGLLVLDILVAAVPQHIGREDRALPCIDPVFHRGLRVGLPRRRNGAGTFACLIRCGSMGICGRGRAAGSACGRSRGTHERTKGIEPLIQCGLGVPRPRERAAAGRHGGQRATRQRRAGARIGCFARSLPEVGPLLQRGSKGRRVGERGVGGGLCAFRRLCFLTWMRVSSETRSRKE